MWIFFYANCFVVGDLHSASCAATSSGANYKTEKECMKNVLGKNERQYIENGKLVVEKREFVKGVCLHLKKDKITKEVYKIIKE